MCDPSGPPYRWHHWLNLSKQVNHLKIACDVILMRFLRISFKRERQKEMTSIIHFKKAVINSACCTTNKTTGRNWSNKYSKLILTVKKKKLQNKIFKKTFKCAQDFAEIIARGQNKTKHTRFYLFIAHIWINPHWFPY